MIRNLNHSIVCYDPTAWAAVPANNGDNGPNWQWGDELLVGFSRGVFDGAKSGHQVDSEMPIESWLARSADGGESWSAWRPENYAGNLNTDEAIGVGEPVDFSVDGFVIRMEGAGYHGNKGPRWFHSYDRGTTWKGPHSFGGLLSHPELDGKEFTGRTGYLVDGKHSLRLFLTMREQPGAGALTVMDREKAFMAVTNDGGVTYAFVSWIVTWDDPYRAAMPSVVKVSDTELVSALRRKCTERDQNWIDCFHSSDKGNSWQFLSRACETELSGTKANGNPPALIRLADGRQCLSYGNRSERAIFTRFSADNGISWSDPLVLRSDFHSANGSPDLGYVRLFERTDGSVAAVYFWCTEKNPQTHIECTVFSTRA